MIIQKKSLADMIAETLKQQITEGTYRAGDKLPTEPELMKTFGVGSSGSGKTVGKHGSCPSPTRFGNVCSCSIE